MQARTEGIAALSLIGGIALFAALGAVALAVALGRDDAPAGADDLSSYYFRAVIEVEQEDDVLDSVLGWYEAPDRWRWDFGDGQQQPDAGAVQMSDGETVVYYDRETNTYFRQASADYNQARPAELTDGPPLITGSFFLGWLPYGDRERFFGALGTGSSEDGDGGEIAGRQTDVVIVTGQHGNTTFWVDRELPFVLKYEAEASGGSQSLIRAEVVDLVLNETVDDDVFRFHPPALAREVPPPGQGLVSSSGSGVLGGAVTAPAGFLTPTYTPSAYNMVETAAEYSGALGGQQQTQYSVRWENAGNYLSMVQQFRAGGLSETQKQGSPVRFDGVDGYDQTTPAGPRLVFATGDIVVTLEANALDLNELIRIAESVR